MYNNKQNLASRYYNLTSKTKTQYSIYISISLKNNFYSDEIEINKQKVLGFAYNSCNIKTRQEIKVLFYDLGQSIF